MSIEGVKLDIKTVITIVAFAVTMGGFYYTTQLRLDNLEGNVMSVEKQLKIIKKRINKGKVKK